MALVEIEIPDYDPAVGLKWPMVAGTSMDAAARAGEFVIRANTAGLRFLAFQLLALAQDGVPDGNHLHFDGGAQLEEGSASFVIERGFLEG